MMKLPVVTGSNLLRRKIHLPDDLRGQTNLLFIPFQQWQQMEVNSWVPWMSQLEQTTPDFHYFELPTIERRNVLSQTLINEGMRMGIPDSATRERTITLYINKSDFKERLDMPDEDHIYLLLTDQKGNILWRTYGTYSPEKASEMMLAIQAFNSRDRQPAAGNSVVTHRPSISLVDTFTQ
jgi:hypothetical protein